jgi:hypothetical protein
MATIKKLTQLATALATIGLATTAHAQSQWQSWNSLNVSADVTKKLTAQIGHTRAFDMSNGFKPTFSQTLLQLSYDHSRQWDFSGGVQFIRPANTTTGTRTRLFVRAAHTQRFDQLNWTNSLRLETNSQNENRFRQRIILSTRLGLRKRLEFLNLSPSIMYSLFYNIGGNPIRYYDENKVLVARQTPDGFHRGRLTLSVNSKINDMVRVNVFYMRQHEFNFLTPDNRKMNVFDPVRNRILRPFDNFNVLGVSVNVSLDDLINL